MSPTNGCKCIADPRKIKHIESPHWVAMFEGFVPVTEDKKVKTCERWRLEPTHIDKIVVNHYRCMSWEEYANRAPRGEASALSGSKYSKEFFAKIDLNDEFDDGILKYRDERAKDFKLPDKSHADERLLNALMINLSPTLTNAPPEFYEGKMETFLTCRAVASYLKTKLTDEALIKIFEEASLKAILRSVSEGVTLADVRLLLSELPNLLSLPYPVITELREACLHTIMQMMNIMRLNNRWKDFVELDYLQRLLKNFKE